MSESTKTQNERALQEGFTLGRVVWFGGVGDWQHDWLFYVENEHTLVSMFRGHALHPFERLDRACYFFCIVCFTLFMSAYVQNAHPIHQGVVQYGLWITLSSALLVVYEIVLRFLATSPCMQPGGSLHGFCWFCRDCCVDAGKQGLYVASLCSVGFLVAGIVLAATADVDPGMYFATFFLMRACSYLGEFVPLAYYFYTKREQQRDFWLDGATGGPYPLGFSLPDPIFIRETRWHGTHARERWPGEDGDVENPMRSSRELRQQHKDARERRGRQIEML
eukprot:CAMPEP_0119277632 /NCGR_PEP_ID=MMETSP1329-20130426/17572_1 /TAXON_ID=114041 /ORGANISM="Genus nov. species nov., Strain RCC1024" /LENGTH=277 /DNA_ID=CAMNT_0007278117 /DNA_START=237 /DNA_END=1066 /DNA_ORIENTATION=-